MAGVTKAQLQKEITDILKDADLASLSAKKVRQQLEEKFECDLTARKKEIDSLVMDVVNSKVQDEEGDEEEEDGGEDSGKNSEESEPEVAPKKGKRSAPTRKTPAKKKKKGSSDEEEESGSGDASDEEYSPKKTAAAKAGKKKGGKKKKGSDSDSDEDWKKPKKTKKAGAGKGKGTGFTRAYTLSPDLAALMGAEALPRHEVVKKMWAMIKERNLYDPKNKQYAICDSDLIKVIGVKRFRTFAMLKYLRPHFIN